MTLSDPPTTPFPHPVEPRSAQRWTIAILAIVVAASPFLVARAQFLTGDPTYYLGLARALADGNGYRFMGTLHTYYPPGLPLLLAPVVALGGRDPIQAQIMVAVFSLVSFGTSLWLISRNRPELTVPMALIHALSAPIFILATGGIRSELPFLAATGAALALVTPDADKRLGRSGIVATALLVAAAVLLRTVGVALAVALAVAFVQRRVLGHRRDETDARMLAGAAGGMIATVAWMAWGWWIGGESYLDQLFLASPHEPDLGRVGWAGLAIRALSNLPVRLTTLGEMAFNLPWLQSSWSSPVVVLLGLTAVTGLWIGLRRPNAVIAWYVLGYSGIILIWPFSEGPRFLVPLIPALALIGADGVGYLAGVSWTKPPVRAVVLALSLLLASAEFAGAIELGSRQRLANGAVWLLVAAVTMPPIRDRVRWILRDRARYVGAVLLAAYSIAGSARILTLAHGNVTGVNRSPNRELARALTWLEEHAEPTAVVMAEFASAVTFYTGLPAASLPKTGNAEALLDALSTSGATFLVIADPPRFPYYLPTEVDRLAVIVSRRPGALTPVHRYDSGTIYRIE